MKNTLVIIPTYNEASNIKKLVDEIFYTTDNINILIIDDNSPDGTGEIARQISQKDNRLIYIGREKKAGLGSAYKEGFKYAIKENFEFIMTMDADFSHSPKAIPDFLSAIKNADLVIGSRYIKGGKTENWPLKRKILSKGGNLFAKILLSLPTKDSSTGFRCIRTECIKKLGVESFKGDGYVFHIETTYKFFKANFKIIEIPITFTERTQGKSKISRGIVTEAFSLVINLRFKKQ